jgi:hypothetical protein
MKLVFILLSCAFALAAQAQGTGQQSVSTDPPHESGLASLIQIELELSSDSDRVRALSSEALTSEYRSRIVNQADWLHSRYGLLTADQTMARVSLQHSSRFPAGSGPLMAQELRLVAGHPLVGLRLERHNVLMAGDELSLRSGSDVQTLARLTGTSISGTESDWLSVLGWRSRSELHWKAGDPARQLQWQLNAAFDRRAANQKANVEFRVMRHF